MTEFHLRIFAPDRGVSRVEVLRDGSSLSVGNARLDSRVIGAAKEDPKAYGLALRDALFESEPIRRAYTLAMADGPVRLRLQIDPEAAEAHALRWESLILPINGEDLPAAASPQSPFSRYLALDSPEPSSDSSDTAHLLLALANPGDLRQLTPLDVEAEIANLVEAWEDLLSNGELRVTVLAGGATLSPNLRQRLAGLDCELLEEPASISRISSLLAGKEALHLVAHGNLTASRRAVLVLQKDDGTLDLIEEDLLLEKLNVAELRFVFLQSCRSAGAGAFVGLAPRLVQLGIPSVVAMQDFVPMDDAREFSAAFYRTLLREGAADVAANTGRQAILRANSGNWSIPVLFSRLRDCQIWERDPICTVTRHIAADCRMDKRVQNPFPVEVVLARSGLGALQHGSGDGAGPRLNFLEGAMGALAEAGDARSAFVILLGNRGRAKTTLLKLLFAELAASFLDAQAPVPAQLHLADCVQSEVGPARTVARAMLRVYRDHGFDLDPERINAALARRSFIFLVDGDAELTAAGRADATGVLADFSAEHPQHKFLFTADTSLFDRTLFPEDSTALVIQPMRIVRVIEYLESQENAAVRGLVARLRESAIFDLAEVPWLLSSLIEDALQGARIDTRTVVLDRFVREGMSRVGGPPGMRSRAEEALNRLAWRMQGQREVVLEGSEVYRILAEARGNREFPLEDFLAEIQKSRLLLNNGDEGASFAYAGLQSFFCARFLNQSTQWERQLEDITATLGRVTRMRWWEDTLVLLSGMTDSADVLLRMILAGSALTEGEQVFLAARCLHEARRAGRAKPGEIGQDVVDQIVDTLMWRSNPQSARSVSVRRKAIEALSLLQETRVVGHLFSLALEKVRLDSQGGFCFDYSAVRGSASLALRAMPEAALAYARSDERLSSDADVQTLLNAWFTGDLASLGTLLNLDNPSVSSVAAFALSTFRSDEALELLVRRFALYAGLPGEGDILWAIADTLCLLNPLKVTEKAILPFLDKPRWAVRVAHMIGRLGIASLEGAECQFLRRCLLSGDAYLQGRSLRAYSAILSQQRETPGSRQAIEEIRTLCHDLVADDRAAAARRACIRLPEGISPEGWWQLRYQAFESLRSIGDSSSVEVLRRTRRPVFSETAAHLRFGVSLNQLSFEIGEEIYWRLTGGLAGESYRPLVSHHTATGTA